jgi:hypothetical protein
MQKLHRRSVRLSLWGRTLFCEQDEAFELCCLAEVVIESCQRKSKPQRQLEVRGVIDGEPMFVCNRERFEPGSITGFAINSNWQACEAGQDDHPIACVDPTSANSNIQRVCNFDAP